MIISDRRDLPQIEILSALFWLGRDQPSPSLPGCIVERPGPLFHALHWKINRSSNCWNPGRSACDYFGIWIVIEDLTTGTADEGSPGHSFHQVSAADQERELVLEFYTGPWRSAEPHTKIVFVGASTLSENTTKSVHHRHKPREICQRISGSGHEGASSTFATYTGRNSTRAPHEVNKTIKDKY